MAKKRNLSNPVKAGIAVGIVWALSVFLTALIAMLGVEAWLKAVQFIGDFYIGYGATFGGLIIGSIYGFIDGFIGGFLVVWIYEKLK